MAEEMIDLGYSLVRLKLEDVLVCPHVWPCNRSLHDSPNQPVELNTPIPPLSEARSRPRIDV